eukprot:1261899-Pyramimonas_sp.AAC.1
MQIILTVRASGLPKETSCLARRDCPRQPREPSRAQAARQNELTSPGQPWHHTAIINLQRIIAGDAASTPAEV